LAVARNAVKRELYLLAQRAELLSLKKDIVIVAMKSINLEEYDRIIKLFIEAIKL
jgi:RNase P protein component